jgi:hypothetical protein
MNLLEAVRAAFRRLHDSPRTAEAYLRWIRAFIALHGGRHPAPSTPPRPPLSSIISRSCVTPPRPPRTRPYAPSSSSTAVSSTSPCPVSMASSAPSGLRLLGALVLRVKDVDLDRRQLMVRRGRRPGPGPALLPVATRDALRALVAHVSARHRAAVAIAQSHPPVARGDPPGGVALPRPARLPGLQPPRK